MDSKEWELVIDDAFVNCHAMLDSMKKELSKIDGPQAFKFMQPMKNLLYEALTDLYHHKHDREKHGEDILKDLDIEE